MNLRLTSGRDSLCVLGSPQADPRLGLPTAVGGSMPTKGGSQGRGSDGGRVGISRQSAMLFNYPQIPAAKAVLMFCPSYGMMNNFSLCTWQIGTCFKIMRIIRPCLMKSLL